MLNRKTRYLQIALNSTLENAAGIISSLPASPRIIIEAGTPLIKRYGMDAVRKLNYWWSQKAVSAAFDPYIVADVSGGFCFMVGQGPYVTFSGRNAG